MMKQMMTGAVLLSVLVAGAACGKQDTPAASGTANAGGQSHTTHQAPAAAKESQDTVNVKAYLAARMAEEKVDFVFHDNKDKDGNFVLNKFYPDADKAKTFLKGFYDAAIVDQMVAFYLQPDGKVNKDNYFKKALSSTKKEDMTFDSANTNDQVKFTTKEGAVYTLKKTNEQFLVTNVEQK
jgi:major membrane immunogen (membrane-anchored lipoprotein)